MAAEEVDLDTLFAAELTCDMTHLATHCTSTAVSRWIRQCDGARWLVCAVGWTLTYQTMQKRESVCAECGRPAMICWRLVKFS